MYCIRCGQPLAVGALACAACQAPIPPALLPKPPIDQSLGVLPLDFALPVADSLGALMDNSLKTFLSTFPLLVKLTLIVWLPVSLVANYLIYTAGRQEDVAFVFRVSMWTESIFGTLLAPAVIYGVVASRRHGAPPSVVECFRWGRRQWARTFGNRLLSGILILLGTLLLIVPGIIVWSWYVFVDAVVAIEGDEQSNVLTRSKELTEGARLRFVGAGAIALVLVLLISFVAALPLAISDHWALSGITDVVIEMAVQFLAVVFVVAYLDRRRTELAARPPGEPPMFTLAGQL